MQYAGLVNTFTLYKVCLFSSLELNQMIPHVKGLHFTSCTRPMDAMMNKAMCLHTVLWVV